MALKPGRTHQRPKIALDARGTLAMTPFNHNGRLRNDPVTLGVLHDTESGDAPGTKDLGGVISWWQNPASGGSAHLVVDKDGNVAYGVDLTRAAPHVGTMNYCSVGIEQIGYSRFTKPIWLLRRTELLATAKWMAYLSLPGSGIDPIPLQKAIITADAKVTRPGWCMHRDLAALHLGTDHTDPGPAYPFGMVLDFARWFEANGWPVGS